MVFAGSVGTAFASARRSARYSSVKAFAVFLLALAFLAVATFSILFVAALQLMADAFSCSFDSMGVMMVVRAALAWALFRADLAFPEALTVHLEALGFLAGATGFLFLGDGGGCRDIVGLCLNLVLDGNLWFLLVFWRWGDVVVEAHNRGDGQVAVGLDE